MARDDNKGSGDSTDNQASGGGSADNPNRGDPRMSLAAGDAGAEDDAVAQRNRKRDSGRNMEKRIRHIERAIIDAFYGGDVRRFDEAAGINYDD